MSGKQVGDVNRLYLFQKRSLKIFEMRERYRILSCSLWDRIKHICYFLQNLCFSFNPVAYATVTEDVRRKQFTPMWKSKYITFEQFNLSSLETTFSLQYCLELKLTS